MEYNDLKKQFTRIEARIRANIDAVFAHGQYILGPEVAELEERLKNMVRARHCLTCSSGTTALDLILRAWSSGPGNAVFTTPFSFFATAESIANTGATPVFVDVDPVSFNLDASHLERAVEAVLQQDERIYPLPARAKRGNPPLHPKAVVVVDIFGHPAAYANILPVAHKYSLLVLEDAAQSFGGSYRDEPLCGCGCDAAAASFFPAKPLGCYGDGGAVFTNDDALAECIDSLRYHGRRNAKDKNDNVRLGTNGRIDTLQACILLAKLEIFEDELRERQNVVERYDKLLASLPGVVCPRGPEDGLSAWAQYTILLPEHIPRKKCMDAMKKDGVPTAVFYPKGMHEQEAFACLRYLPEDFPVVQRIAGRVLSLPMHPYLTEADQRTVATSLRNALGV